MGTSVRLGVLELSKQASVAALAYLCKLSIVAQS